jgi:hypothetical protein
MLIGMFGLASGAHAVSFSFDYITPFTGPDGTFTPALTVDIADELWAPNGGITGTLGTQTYPGVVDRVPYEGVRVRFNGASTNLVGCDAFPHVGTDTCSISPLWLQLVKYLAFDLVFQGNFMRGSLGVDFLDHNLRMSSDSNGIWSFQYLASDQYPTSVCGIRGGPPCAATGIWRRVVPEPGTIALLGFGLVGLGLSRRRKAA